jgi:TRAP-type C4-dicarboxylate transport system permease small subunit
MEFLDKLGLYLNRLLMIIAGIFLLGMIALTCTNILLRFFWFPVRGTFELMGFFGAVAAAFALGYTQVRRGHIAVDVLISMFSEKTRRTLRIINETVCLIFFALVAWQMAVKAGTLRMTGEVTETLRIIYYPFTYAVAIGFGVLSLVFLIELLKTLFPQKANSR